MTAPIDLVLQRAEAHEVRPSGRDRWRMRGACHGGRNRSSVSIALGNDGRVLLHCWAGCSAERVAESLGLTLADLFPPRPGAPGGGNAPERRPFSVRELLDALAAELRVAWVILGDVQAGRELGARDRERAGVARDRCVALLEELRNVR